MTSVDRTRQAFLELIDRPRVSLAPAVLADERPQPGIYRERFTYAVQAGERVSGLLLKETRFSGPRPAVIVAHATGGSKEAVLPLLTALSARGFVAVAIDARHHGERAGGVEAGSEAYVSAILEKYRSGSAGYPFLYDTVWDLMRLVDYLQHHPEVDPRRLGLMGISKGGMETYLAAAADPRLRVAVPVLGVQSYRYGLDHEAWRARAETFQAALDGAAAHAGVERPDAEFVRSFYDRIVPGIYAEFDAPSMLTLIAPRPLLVVNGELDVRTPGLDVCRRPAEAAYARAGVPERLQVHVQRQVGHQLTEAATELVFDWLSRWLRV